MIDYTQDTISIAPCMRAMLVKRVSSRMDIIKYCNSFLNLELKLINRAVYKGSCPWCGKKEVFFCYKTAGTCCCDSCKIIGDFFDIITIHWNFDLSFSLNLLAWQLEKSAEFASKLHIKGDRAGTIHVPVQGGITSEGGVI